MASTSRPKPVSRTPSRHPRESGDPVFHRTRKRKREAAAHWIARSSRAMTAWFAGTTRGEMLHPSSSPSLPWRDDLDLVAVLQRRLRPLAARQHVVIQCDRKMRALIFEFAEQRVDA